MFMVALAAFSASLLAVPAQADQTVPSAAEASRCEAWIRARPIFPAAASPEVFIISATTACFDGDITKDSIVALQAWITRAPKDSEPLLLVRSRGGDLGTGISIMDDLQAANAEVRVVDFCGPVCADYFFAGARHRSVTDGAVILFRGGWSAKMRLGLAAALDRAEESGKAPANFDWTKARRSALAQFDEQLAQQDQDFARIGVNSAITNDVDSAAITALPDADCDSTRTVERKAVFFTIAELRELGVRIERGRPAADPREVNERLRQMGSPYEACAAPRSLFRMARQSAH
jgi:hypothetical protein